MASSSYYRSLYNNKKQEVREYDDNLRELRKIVDNINYDLFFEIFDVNDSLTALMSDLKKGIKDNAVFTSRATGLENKKEKKVGSDPYISVTLNAVEDEISRVSKLKAQAISDRDYYYKKYVAKKEEEREEWLRKLAYGGN